MHKKLLLFTLTFLLCSCKNNQKPAIAFYYWKTVFKISNNEKSLLKKNQVKKLYVRYFDIDLNPQNQKPYPKSPIKFNENPKDYFIIPVVYIKNEVFLVKTININDLATKTYDFIQQINNQFKINCNEIQIDCDWTLTTKENYINYINTFKKLSKKKLSATIRLHQIKYYRKTKIPNVDKGVLMYYNFGKIDTDSSNSIYDKHIASKYLNSLKKYPLSLNVALPIYSWGIHIRNHRLIGLKNKIDIKELKKDVNFIAFSNNFFKSKNNNYKNGIFYRKNDILKIEQISEINLLEMSQYLSANLLKTPAEIIFYDLDEFNTKKYEKEIFKKIVNNF